MQNLVPNVNEWRLVDTAVSLTHAHEKLYWIVGRIVAEPQRHAVCQLQRKMQGKRLGKMP